MVLPPITVRTLAGDEYTLVGLQLPAWPNSPVAPLPPACQADLNALLSAQHPDSDLADPTQYVLLAAVVGLIDATVPLSPLVRGADGAAGLLRLFRGELDLDSVVAMFVEQEDDEAT